LEGSHPCSPGSGNRSQSRTMIGGAYHLWLWAPLRAAPNKRGSRRRTQTNVCRATVLTTNPNPDPISKGAVVRGNCLQRRRCHRCPHRHRHLLCTKHRLKHRCLFPGNRSQSRTMIGGACHLWLWAPLRAAPNKRGSRRSTQTNVCSATVLTTNPNTDPISEGAAARGNRLQRHRRHRCPH
jgi:hypothetical protein